MAVDILDVSGSMDEENVPTVPLEVPWAPYPMNGNAITKINAQGSARSEKPQTCAAVTKANIPMTADEAYGLNLIARENNEKGLVNACRILM